MKKVVTGILVIFYMAVSSGIAVELHYCMGSKAGMDFFGSANEKCGKCGMSEKDSGCCHDEFKFYKLNDSHKSAYNDISLAAPEFVVLADHAIYNWQMPVINKAASPNNHSPRAYATTDICVINCVFRI